MTKNSENEMEVAVAAVTQAANALADTLNQIAAVYASMVAPLMSFDNTPAAYAMRGYQPGSAARLLEQAAGREPTSWKPPHEWN